MSHPRLLTLCGSLRAGSYNRMLLAEAVRAFGPAVVEAADLRLPLMDEDVESREGIPPAVQRLASLMRGADAVLVATPEYNKSVPGVLKNALDWVSRVPGHALRGKPVAIMSAAAGRAGGERAQFALRLCLTPFRPRLIAGPEVMVGRAADHFDAAGRLTDPQALKLVAELVAALRAEMAPAATPPAPAVPP
jgi:chromate reductase